MCEYRTGYPIKREDGVVFLDPDKVEKEAKRFKIGIGLPPYLVIGTRENDRYTSCMNRYRKDYPCICGRCFIHHMSRHERLLYGMTETIKIAKLLNPKSGG